MTQSTVKESPELRLTERERQVLELLAAGLHLEVIAQELGIGLETVRTHIHNAAERLGAPNSTAAVAIAIRSGLI